MKGNAVNDSARENEADFCSGSRETSDRGTDFCSGSRETSDRGTSGLRILTNSATQMLNGVRVWFFFRMAACEKSPLIRPDGHLLPCNGGDGTASRLILLLILLFTGTVASAAEKPVVRLKLELLSIRNRSSGPLPVRVKLEYNQPQILEGDLELSIYDAVDIISSEDLMATIRHEGIVLAGRDYEFNTVLPPLRTAVTQNWAVQAWFVTKKERIPLSSIPDRPAIHEPHDLLTTSPRERGVLACSCVDDPISSQGSINRRFLESALSLDNYNPIYEELEARYKGSAEMSAGRMQNEKSGRTIIHYACHWAARDLPLDPLSFCAFDLVMLSDGALARLSSNQMTGLMKWVRAGGSVCVLPDAPMKPMHLDFLRTLFEGGPVSAADLTLDSDGRLLVVSEQNDPVIMRHFGLGRAVLLPVVESLADRLSPQELGSVVAFLWKVRKDQPVWKGEFWNRVSILEQLRQRGIDAHQDEKGIYVTDLRYQYNAVEVVNGRYYLDTTRQTRQTSWGVDDRLSPRTEPLLAVAEQLLLPSDVEMVPTWVIGLILSGYVLTIGPVDYFVLGWLRMRKYTWILFPIVTAVFTTVTVLVANAYMGSNDTGGRLVITDLVEDRIPARRTVLETLYYSAQADVRTEHTSELVVQAEDSFSAADWNNMYSETAAQEPDAPLSYSGHFPQKYTTVQRVRQWSPVTIRTLSLEPTDVTPPPIDWNDVTLVTTPDGHRRLRQMLQQEAARSRTACSAVVYHSSKMIPILGNVSAFLALDVTYRGQPVYYSTGSRDSVVQQLFSSLPTAASSNRDIFRLVSQLSPEGAGSLEDLTIVDPSDPKQWALAILQQEGDNFYVYRKQYLVEETQP